VTDPDAVCRALRPRHSSGGQQARRGCVGPSAYAALTETHAEEEPVAKRGTLDQLTAAVAHAELIPTNRPLTAGEIALLDDLAAQLRAAFFSDRSEEITGLLRRVSAVRTGKRDAGVPAPAKQSPAAKKPAKVQKTPPAQKAMAVQARLNGADGPEPAERAATPSASDAPARKPKEKGKTIGQIHSELSEMAAKQELGRKSRQRLEEIVNEAASLVSKGPDYRRLYERALQIQKKTLTPPRGSKWRGGPAGLVQNSGLSQGGREVLGGLPSSRRGH